VLQLRTIRHNHNDDFHDCLLIQPLATGALRINSLRNSSTNRQRRHPGKQEPPVLQRERGRAHDFLKERHVINEQDEQKFGANSDPEQPLIE